MFYYLINLLVTIKISDEMALNFYNPVLKKPDPKYFLFNREVNLNTFFRILYTSTDRHTHRHDFFIYRLIIFKLEFI